MANLILRYELLQDGSASNVKWRPLVDLHHATLCRQAGLDPARHWYDVPRSMYEAAGRGDARIEGRSISGFIFRAGSDRPVGKIVLVHESERFRDVDPRDRREFERL